MKAPVLDFFRRPGLPVGRALSTIGAAALLATAWRGWGSAGAQLALEGLWSLCSVR